MGTSAASVQVKVVKGAGAGTKKRMKCSDILACFDPPIEFGTHSEMVGSMDGYQAEHIIPTSAAHVSGRGGDRITGCTGYSTSGALTWMVRDGQSAMQEHKILTDAMREFSQANDLANRNAPLNEWLDQYKEGTKNALKNAKPKRKITNKNLDEDSLIDAAAECIRAAAAKAFADMGIKPNTPMRNPWPATGDQRAAAAAAARGGRGGRR